MKHPDTNLTHILPGNVLLKEVDSLLSEGYTVTIQGQGKSMRPFIHDSKDRVVLNKSKEGYHVGDIVLARMQDDAYLLHRIYAIRGDKYILMGDGNVYAKEECHLDDICGRATHIIREGHSYACSSPNAQRQAQLWRWFLPIRRILLFLIYGR